MARSIFYSVVAQHENLGDYAIRRVVADWISRPNLKVYVCAIGMPDRWIAGFDDVENTTMVRTRKEWVRAVSAGMLFCRPVIVLPPGPQLLSAQVPAVRRQIALLALTFLARLRGGTTVKIGRSYRGDSRLAITLENCQVRLSSFYSVRDDSSAAIIGSARVVVHPDVAMAWQPPTDVPGSRRHVAISLRNGRPGDATLLVEVVRSIRASGLEPLIISQVSVDTAWNRELSVLVNSEFVDLADERNPRDLLALAANTYARCTATITNRLHVALLGLACGSTPIVYGDAGRDKIVPCLDVFYGSAEIVSTGSSPSVMPSFLASERCAQSALQARRRLDDIGTDVVRALVG